MKLLLSAAVLTMAFAPAAYADPGNGKGHGNGHGQGASAHANPNTYVNHGQNTTHAPPGLAKKPYGMPPGQAKKMWQSGQRLPGQYYQQSQYSLSNPAQYSLSPAPAGYKWVLVGNDAYLVRDNNSGLISQVVANIFR